jgi:hypothetical protein
MDTFGDMSPIEAVTPAPDSTGGGHDLDTFDNGDVVLEEPKKEEEKSELKDESKNNQKEQLEDQEEKDEKKEAKSEEKEEPKSEEKEEVKEEKEPEVKLEGKTLRLKEGDKAIDVNENTTVKVKVKGKNEFISIADLKQNYSGKIAYDETMAEAKTKLEDAETKSAQFEGQKNAIVQDLKAVMEKMDDPEGNPLDALKYLLDITGKPVHTYMKRALEAQIDQLSELQEMTETERELYWNRQETDWLRNNQATREKQTAEEKTQRDSSQQIVNLREQYGVSEKEYAQVQSELEQELDDVTPEQVVQLAKFKPVYTETKTFVDENFAEELGDTDLEDLTAGTARILFRNPKATQEEAVKMAARELGFEVSTVDEDIAELESKNPSKPVDAKKGSDYKYGRKTTEQIESFDDFED